MRRERVDTHLDIDVTIAADTPGASTGVSTTSIFSAGCWRSGRAVSRSLFAATRISAGPRSSPSSPVAAHRRFRTVMALTVGLETDLPFAGLHALLAPALDR